MESQNSVCAEVLAVHTQPVWAVAFSPDGRTLASASKDQTVRLSELSGTLPWAISHDHLPMYHAATFLPESGMLAAIDVSRYPVLGYGRQDGQLDGPLGLPEATSPSVWPCLRHSRRWPSVRRTGDIHFLDLVSRRLRHTIPLARQR